MVYVRPEDVIISLPERAALRFIDGGVTVRWFSRTEFRIVFLLAAADRPVLAEQLIEQLWGDREDGGPDYVLRALSVYFTRLRQKLNPLGLRIENIRYGGGWRLCVDGAPVRAREAKQEKREGCEAAA
jgi:DNA-binding response OmpR family regulator